MKFLIVEDEFTSRKLLQKFLSPFGECDIAVDGEEAVEAFKMSLEENNPYDVICLDIMMPNMDGQEALKKFRQMEKEHGIKGSKEVKIIMTTALNDAKNVVEAYYRGGATSYIVKPINKEQLLEEMCKLGILNKDR